MSRLNSIALMLAIFSTWGLSACNDAQDGKALPKGEILFIGKTFSNPYFVEMADGVVRAGKMADVTVRTRSGSAENDVRSQTIIFESFLAKRTGGRRGIVLAPASSGAEFNDLIKRANAASVPVAIVDTALDEKALAAGGAHVLTTIASDNFSGAVQAGAFVAEHAPTCGPILLLVGVPQQATAVARSRGFEEGLRKGGQARSCKFRLVRRIANWNRDEARQVMSAMLPLKGDPFVGVFGSNDQMALGAVEALEQAPPQRTRPIVVGFDAVPEALQAVKAGRLDATMRQQPRKMGEAAVTALRDAWNGKAVAATTSISVELTARPAPQK